MHVNVKALALCCLLSFGTVYGSSHGSDAGSESNEELQSQAGTVVHRRAVEAPNGDDGRISPATQAEVRDAEDFLHFPEHQTFNVITIETLQAASAFNGMGLGDTILAMLKGHSFQSNSRERFVPDELNILQVTTLYEAWFLFVRSQLSKALKVGYHIVVPEDGSTRNKGIEEIFALWYGAGAELLQAGLPQARVAMLRHKVVIREETQESLEEFLWKLATIGKNTVAALYLSDRGVLQTVNSIADPRFDGLNIMANNESVAARDHVLYLIAHSEQSIDEKRKSFAEKLASEWILPFSPSEKPFDRLTDDDFASILPRKSYFSTEVESKKLNIIEIVEQHAKYLKRMGLLADMSRDHIENLRERDPELTNDVPARHTVFYLIATDPDLSLEEKQAMFIDKINHGWTLPPCFGEESFKQTAPQTLLSQFNQPLYTAKIDGCDISFLALAPRQAIALHVPLAAKGNVDSMRILFHERLCRYGRVYEGGLFGMLLTQIGATANDMDIMRKLIGGWIEISAIMHSKNE